VATVINFNKARKHKQRADAVRQAAENRAKFGRTKSEKQRDQAETEESRRRLDQLRRDPPEDS